MKALFLFLTAFALTSFTASTAAQTKRKPRKTTARVEQPKQTEVEPTAKSETLATAPAKKNDRAESSTVNSNDSPNITETPKKANSERSQPVKSIAAPSPFVYEFSNPQFQVTSVKIEHDASGKGKITFERQDLDEPITDPIQISSAALERINNLWKELNFLDSTENYQSSLRNYAHLGTMKLRRQEGDRKREAEFNWTENKTAENLANEYKKLSEQFIWMFEIGVARENQPLESPKLMDKLDSLIKRGQISDAVQILPVLREIADDERLSLITRNHATRIIKSIEKQAEKKSK